MSVRTSVFLVIIIMSLSYQDLILTGILPGHLLLKQSQGAVVLLVLVRQLWHLLIVAMALEHLVTRAAAGVTLAAATPHLPRGEARSGKKGDRKRREWR